MLVNTEWLKEWVAFDWVLDETANRLTMAGLEIDAIDPVQPFADELVIGQINAVEPHAEVEQISICRVDVGQSSELQVVCGAANVKPGRKYPVALPGATVGGKTIGVAELYSLKSEAMLCSEADLGLIDSASELMELDADAPVGESLNVYLKTDDQVMHVELTPNRADCLSIRGVAREIAILAQTDLVDQNSPVVVAQTNRNIPVDVKVPEDCPVFCNRVIDGIQVDAKTPDWMQRRLHRLGLRSIHPIVDVTNYVMLELGQPMHAFDTDVIDAAEIIVRHSIPGEKLVLLDGEELDLGATTLLISDRNGPLALAGVMGGGTSGISQQTTSIMLEAAFFSPRAIRRSVARFGLNSDASHRFERGVDPEGQRAAIERATELILEIAGGIPGPTQEIRLESYIDYSPPCYVRHARVNRVLGIEIKRHRVESILSAINASVSTHDEGWLVTPPAYRFDLSAEHDQIEEVARIYGYDQVPSRMHFNLGIHRNLSEKVVSQESIRSSLHALGYQEAITYSFVDPKVQKKIHPSSPTLPLANPIAENLSVMRVSLWPGLLDAFLENYRRSQDSIRLYEIGRVFQPTGETDMLGGLSYGNAAPTQWGIEARPVDYYDIKGDLEQLFQLPGKTVDLAFRVETIHGLHPGRSAGVYVNGRRVGTIGELNMDVLDEVNSSNRIYVFEIEFDILSHRNVPEYTPISRYPAVARDLSLVIPTDQSVAELTNTIRQSAGKLLETVTLFDVYFNFDVANRFKSVAYRLSFRSHTRTLTDLEVETAIQNILYQSHRKYQAKLRE